MARMLSEGCDAEAGCDTSACCSDTLQRYSLPSAPVHTAPTQIINNASISFYKTGTVSHRVPCCIIRMRSPLSTHRPSEYMTKLPFAVALVVVVVVVQEALVMEDVGAMGGSRHGASRAQYPA